MKNFTLKIITPDGLKFSGECESLLVRTTDGDVEILAGHTDLLATLGVGRARLRIDGKIERFGAVQGGTLTVLSGNVTLLPVTFEFSDEIDISRAERARSRAEEKIASATSHDAVDLAHAKLMRALNRISVAKTK
jgi:F-type H+-transporting ATPase subunit epsilon